MEGACYRHNPIDCGDLNSAGVTTAAAMCCHDRTHPTHSFQQRCHAARSAVIAVSLSGTCAYRRKVCLTSDSCCRAPHAAVCGPTKMSRSNIRHAGSCARCQGAQRPRLDVTVGRPVMEEVRLCGCEHSSVGPAVASPDSELNSAVVPQQQQ